MRAAKLAIVIGDCVIAESKKVSQNSEDANTASPSSGSFTWKCRMGSHLCSRKTVTEIATCNKTSLACHYMLSGFESALISQSERAD